jgi:hypothetical protein
MMALLSLAVTLLSAFSSPAYAEQIQPQTLTIHHRFLPLDRSSPLPSFLPRLELALSSPTDVSSGLASTKPNVSAQDVQPLSHQDRLRAVNVGEDGLYQLGLELPNGEWATTSMRAVRIVPTLYDICDILSLGSDSSLALMAVSSPPQARPSTGRPHPLSRLQSPAYPPLVLYSQHPSRRLMSCIFLDCLVCCPRLLDVRLPQDARLCSNVSSPFSIRSTRPFADDIILGPRILRPMLSTPPPLDAETGRQAVVVPEKSFIQKYWVYMVIPIVLLIGELPFAPVSLPLRLELKQPFSLVYTVLPDPDGTPAK